MTILQRLLSMCVLLLLAACGGGGGDAGSPAFGSGSGATGGGGTGSPTSPTVSSEKITLSITSSTVTATAPATVTVTLRDAGGTVLPGRVINVATARTGLATLSAASVLTNAQGSATVTVLAAAGGATGADEVTATASSTSGTSTAAASGAIAFNVTGATATLAAQLSPNNNTLRASTGPVDFIATLRDAAGQPLANQVVSFRAAGGLVTLTPASALTDATGQARTKAAPTNASVNAAETLSASTAVNGRDLQNSVNVQLVGESPSIALTLSSSNVSATAPATVRARVLSADGAPVVGTVVSFSSQFNLGSFNPATATTDSNGVASSVVSPRLANTTGADLLRGTATVGGVTRFEERSAQFTGTASSGTPVLQLALSTTSISTASPATVTATLSDARAVAVSGQVITFTVVRGLARTNITTSLTDTAGRAVVVLSPANPNSAGADEISAAASFSGASLSATQGFQVQATSITLDSFTAAANPLSA